MIYISLYLYLFTAITRSTLHAACDSILSQWMKS